MTERPSEARRGRWARFSSWISRDRPTVPTLAAGAAAAVGVVASVIGIYEFFFGEDPPGSPPAFVVEAYVRSGEGDRTPDFQNSLAGMKPGEEFQVFAQAYNSGGVEASQGLLRVRADPRLKVNPQSCVLRGAGTKGGFKPCDAALFDGGLLYRTFGAGGWIQVYFNAKIPEAAVKGDYFPIAVIGDSSETPEQEETAVIGVGPARQWRGSA